MSCFNWTRKSWTGTLTAAKNGLLIPLLASSLQPANLPCKFLRHEFEINNYEVFFHDLLINCFIQICSQIKLWFVWKEATMLCNKTSIVPCNIYGGTQLNSQKYAACNAHIICATTGRFKVSFLIASKFIFILWHEKSTLRKDLSGYFWIDVQHFLRLWWNMEILTWNRLNIWS